MTLSKPQQRALLRKQLAGDFGRVCWPTVRSLMDLGLITEDNKRLVVTPAGVAYCNEHHATMDL